MLSGDRGFKQRDLVGREIKQAIHDGVDLAFGFLDFGIELQNLGCLCGEIGFPF
jgi:hypothetical protein